MTEALPWAVAGLIALGAGGYVVHCEHVKKDRAEFISKLEQQAADQQRENENRADRERKAKEQADAKSKREIGNLHRTIERLRDERARASSVPAAPAASSRPDLACFDRAELDRAVGNLEAGVEGLIGEGTAAAIDLDVAKIWADTVLKQSGGRTD